LSTKIRDTLVLHVVRRTSAYWMQETRIYKK